MPNYYDSIPQTRINRSIEVQNDIMTEFSKVMHAAVINKDFRENLLASPLSSIEAGYFGEKFHLPENLLCRISFLKCSSLEQFSLEVVRIIDGIQVLELAEISSY